MKELSQTFRSYDILAYFFPGVATLHALYILDCGVRRTVAEFAINDDLLDKLALFVIAYMIGIFWSSVSREIIRRASWAVYNPRIDILDPREKRASPLDSDLRATIKKEIADLTGQKKYDTECGYAICRSYVAQHCPQAWARRDAVSSQRAMAANFIGPAGLYSCVFFTQGHNLFGALALLALIVLTRKSISHDRLEWKEIYISFLMSRLESRRPSGDKD